jgi:dihydropyrimidinase
MNCSRKRLNHDLRRRHKQKIQGVVETVLSRGRVVIENGEYKGKPGDGRFLKRGTCVAL